MENLSDAELVLKAKNGNELASETLFNRYKPLAKKISRSYFLAGADDDDIFQEAMIGLFKAYNNFKSEESNFSAFATLCINRQIQSAIKSANRQKNRILTEAISLNNQGGFKIADENTLEENVFYIVPSNSPSPDDTLISKETLKEVLKKIDEILSDYEKQILFLYLEGKSYKEISNKVNKSTKSVENALTRLKAKISSIKEWKICFFLFVKINCCCIIAKFKEIKRGLNMKKKILSIVALCLAVCFMFAGCNLLNADFNKGNDNAAVMSNGEVLLTREEIKTAYATYFETYYNSYKEQAFDKMVEDLITEKLVYNDAKNLIESGEIVLTNTEKNYIYDQTFKAVINNLEAYEKQVAKTLSIEYPEDEEGDSQWVYTKYTPYAEVVLNKETNKYEIKLTNKYLAEKEKNGETEYEYVTKEEYESYTEPTKLLSFADFKYEKLQSDNREEQVLATEARRIYLSKLLKNEEGKNLSTDEVSVFNRELERIYEIVYKKFLTTKYYQHKSQSINISETEVLTSYLAKVKETYERYQEDKNKFESEITTSVISANMYGQYSSSSNSIEDVWYVPADYEENFFMVYHIMVKLNDDSVSRISEAKQNLTNGIISEADYDAIVAEEYSKLKLEERDEEGKIVVKADDENAISYDTMLSNLQTELAGATTAQEKGEIFNKYIYKYGTDTGSLQVQKDYFGGTHENWYGYVVGTDNKNNFLDEFVNQARALYNDGNGELGSISNKFQLESWKEEDKKDDSGNVVKGEDGKAEKISKLSYAGYDVMMYGGKIANLFECFDDGKFEISDLGDNALYKLANKRLGITGNKTLFDLVYEDIFSDLYRDLTTELKSNLNKNGNIEKIESSYADLNPLK